MTAKGDVFASFDSLLEEVDLEINPWMGEAYVPCLDLLPRLLEIPIRAGEIQESGRVAKALDAWIATELRRAGFPRDGVWPRTKRPRILPADLAPLEEALESVWASMKDAAGGIPGHAQPVALRRAIRSLEGKWPRAHPRRDEAYVLGDFYSKQIDVVIASWQRGPEVLISTKTQLSSYRKNLKNRHEEAVGEVASLRARHPMAVMGFAYLVRRNIFDEPGAYEILVDILTRLRRPGESFDATMLIVADWDVGSSPIIVGDPECPALDLAAGRFFEDVVAYATKRTPVSEYVEVRRRRAPAQIGALTVSELESLDPEDEIY